MMTEDEIEMFYQSRSKRLQELVNMKAPKHIIGCEALLLAQIILSPDQNMEGLIKRIKEEFPITPVQDEAPRDAAADAQKKAEAWDIAYPALIFLKELGSLTKSGIDDVKRAVDHYNGRPTSPE